MENVFQIIFYPHQDVIYHFKEVFFTFWVNFHIGSLNKSPSVCKALAKMFPFGRVRQCFCYGQNTSVDRATVKYALNKVLLLGLKGCNQRAKRERESFKKQSCIPLAGLNPPLSDGSIRHSPCCPLCASDPVLIHNHYVQNAGLNLPQPKATVTPTTQTPTLTPSYLHNR